MIAPPHRECSLSSLKYADCKVSLKIVFVENNLCNDSIPDIYIYKDKRCLNNHTI